MPFVTSFCGEFWEEVVMDSFIFIAIFNAHSAVWW